MQRVILKVFTALLVLISQHLGNYTAKVFLVNGRHICNFEKHVTSYYFLHSSMCLLCIVLLYVFVCESI